TFGEGHGSEDPERIGLVGGVDAPIINPSQHGAMNHHGRDLSMPGEPGNLRENGQASMALAQRPVLERDNWSPGDPGLGRGFRHLYRRFRQLLGDAEQMLTPLHFLPDI